MKLVVVDFEQIVKSYVGYQKSMDLIELEKSKFSDEVDNIKSEMESIIKTNRLLVDERSQAQQAARFKELQTVAIELESEFRNKLIEVQNTEFEKNLTEVSKIVSDWAVQEGYDLVLNSSSTIFYSEDIDKTQLIKDILNQKGLYIQNNQDDNDFTN
jgi:Skp family chaperone for outer membrane proteins